jgi:hypothetical protein
MLQQRFLALKTTRHQARFGRRLCGVDSSAAARAKADTPPSTSHQVHLLYSGTPSSGRFPGRRGGRRQRTGASGGGGRDNDQVGNRKGRRHAQQRRGDGRVEGRRWKGFAVRVRQVSPLRCTLLIDLVSVGQQKPGLPTRPLRPVSLRRRRSVVHLHQIRTTHTMGKRGCGYRLAPSPIGPHGLSQGALISLQDARQYR